MKITKWISKALNHFKLFRKYRHLRSIRQARRVLIKLIEISKQNNPEARILGYLRKINPFVFEELILCVIEDSNVRITRNTRYTGDGGIDGICHLKEGRVIIQCKRYSSYINQKHVRELTDKVSTGNHYLGVFVHTGKTGEKSKTVVNEARNVIFISGSDLVKIILGTKDIQAHIKSKILYFNKCQEKTWHIASQTGFPSTPAYPA